MPRPPCRIFAAPFGGPIAMCRDEGKVVLHLGAFSRPDIQLFSPSGAPLGRVLWDKGRIVAAGWTSMEELLVVDDGGRVHRFSLHGAHSGEGFSLGAACEEEGLALANGTDFGLAAVVVTGSRARAEAFTQHLVAGTIWVNCFFVRDLSAPFGGSKRSGIGREGGLWSFDFYADVKNTVFAPNGWKDGSTHG